MTQPTDKLYWIEYVDGSVKYFEAEDAVAAYRYFMMEGDHAYDYGYLKHKKPRNKRGSWF